MDKRLLLLPAIWVLSLFLSAGACAQTYDDLWAEADKYMKEDDLPESAMAVLRQIEAKAAEEHNAQWFMKAFFNRVRNANLRGEDVEFSDEIGRLEAWLSSAGDADAACIAYAVAYCYKEQMAATVWNSTAVAGKKSFDEPVEEWTEEMFLDRILGNLRTVYDNMNKLHSCTADDYGIIAESGGFGELTGHNMASLVTEASADMLRDLGGAYGDLWPQSDLSRIKDYDGLQRLLDEGLTGLGEYDFTAVTVNFYSRLTEVCRLAGDADSQAMAACAFIDRYFRSGYDYVALLDSIAASHPDAEKVLPYLCFKKADRWLFYEEGKKRQALDCVEQALADYPESVCRPMLESLRSRILQPQVRATVASQIYPGKSDTLFVSHRNAHCVKLSVYKAKESASALDLWYLAFDKEALGRLFSPYTTLEFELVPPADYEERDTAFVLPPLPAGLWAFVAQSEEYNPNFKPEYVVSSRFTHLYRTNAAKDNEYMILDSESGQPVAGADVLFYEYDYGERKYRVLSDKVVTDENGAFACPFIGRNGAVFSVRKSDDVSYLFDYASGYEPSSPATQNRQISLFTDRGIYRPGQKVYVKGIVYDVRQDNSANVCEGVKGEVSLTSRSGAGVRLEKDYVTNSFGSFFVEFVLPEECPGGTYYISTSGGMHTISVEEYKRPTFYVEMEKPDGRFLIGDSVAVSGRALMFNGFPVQQGKVRYEIILQPIWRNYSYDRWYSSRVVASGIVETDAEGCFDICVKATDDDLMPGDNRIFRYEVKASVTAMNGETQEQSIAVSASDKPFFLSCTADAEVEKANGLQFTPVVVNADGSPQDVVLRYSLTDMRTGQEVLQGIVRANEKMTADCRTLASGSYRLTVVAADDESIKSESIVALFDRTDTLSPVDAPLWVKQLNSEVNGSLSAEFLVATAESNEYVIMDICDEYGIRETRRITLNNEMRLISIPYKAEYGNGISVSIVSQRHGQRYDRLLNYALTEPDMKLTWRWDVFRDRLQPGQEETWKFTLVDASGRPADAEVLAYLYDASLDEIYKNDNHFNIYFDKYLKHTSWNRLWKYTRSLNLYFASASGMCGDTSFDRFRNFMSYGLTMRRFGLFNRAMLDGVSVPVMKSAVTNVAGETAMEATSEEVGSMKLAEEAVLEEQSVEHVAYDALRSDFSETAFFYPMLRTDENGSVSISFTVPESLTEWRFGALSHTRDMLHCMADTSVVTSKEFMLMPDMPRFFRRGDKVCITPAVINDMERPVEGYITLQLLEPVSEKELFSRKLPFSVKEKSTATVRFEFEAPDAELVACRIVASGKNFSDGEQRYIPVLSDRMVVVETKTEVISGDEPAVIDMSSLFNGNDAEATHRSLVLETAASPVWYAVQSLCAVDDVNDNSNAISLAAALYANRIGGYLLQSNGALRSAVEMWKAYPEAEDLQSALSKNEDLKNILLENSPWLLDAASDEEQKRNMAMFLDVNRMDASNAYLLERLSGMQLGSGALSWFKGGDANAYVTRFVATELARIERLTGRLSDVEQRLLARLMDFIYSDIQSIYRWESEYGGRRFENTPMNKAVLQDLYVCALAETDVPAHCMEAYDKYMRKLSSSSLPGFSVAEKAMSVKILMANGMKESAERFFTSLKEYELRDGYGNLHFKSAKTADSAALREQVAAIEAYHAMGCSGDELEALKSWLITRKKRTDWGDPLSSADAVHALLAYGEDVLHDEGGIVVKMGRKKIADIRVGDVAAGNLAGYSRQQINVAERRRVKDLTAVKSGNAQAWVNVYAKYEIPMSRLQSAGEGLGVEKQMFVKRTEGTAVKLFPLAGEKVSAGDIIVSRLVVDVSEPTDFVALKDAAPGCAEKTEQLSGYRFMGGAGCYVENKDDCVTYYFDSLSAGRYVIENEYSVSRPGVYSSGVAVLQSMYAPEYSAHSSSEDITVL